MWMWKKLFKIIANCWIFCSTYLLKFYTVLFVNGEQDKEMFLQLLNDTVHWQTLQFFFSSLDVLSLPSMFYQDQNFTNWDIYMENFFVCRFVLTLSHSCFHVSLHFIFVDTQDRRGQNAKLLERYFCACSQIHAGPWNVTSVLAQLGTPYVHMEKHKIVTKQ